MSTSFDCVFIGLDKGDACLQCGYRLVKDYPRSPSRNCTARNGESHRSQPGDALEELPTSYGITKEWSAALKENGNREPACANRGRQLEQLLKVDCSCHESGEKNVPVYDCAVESIRRCLPTFHPKNSDRRKWSERKPESDIYQLCDACPHFSMKEKNP